MTREWEIQTPRGRVKVVVTVEPLGEPGSGVQPDDLAQVASTIGQEVVRQLQAQPPTPGA